VAGEKSKTVLTGRGGRRSSLNSLLALVGLLCSLAASRTSESASATASSELFFPSGNLKIQAYLYRPSGDGPFPAVIYNHGSRRGNERRPTPRRYIGDLLTRAGFVALVVERRGYGRSDGATLTEEVDGNWRRLVPRLQAETDDVLAARSFLAGQPFVDPQRIGVMGWSYGGIVTMFAVSRSRDFAVAVDQAGAALTWNGIPSIRSALIAAAEKSTTPTLFMVAENDRTTDSITALAEIYKRRDVAHRAVIYEPFSPQGPASDTPPGHRVFSAQGVKTWGNDVVDFLGRYLGAESVKKN